MHIDYDNEADVLYISFHKPQKANDSLMEDNIIYHYRDEELVGITVLRVAETYSFDKVNLSLSESISALKNLSPEDREFFLENLLAALSPDYLASIKEARRDYKEGRTLSHEEVFK